MEDGLVGGQQVELRRALLAAWFLIDHRLGTPALDISKGGGKHLSWKTTVGEKIDLNLRILC